MNVNNDKLYEMVKTLREYVKYLVNLNPNDAIKMDILDWKYCLSDIGMCLIVIEKFMKQGKDD